MNIQEDLKSLGEAIAKLRIDANQQQKTLAYEAGISVRTLQRLEGGDNVRLDALIKVLKQLGQYDNLRHTLSPSSSPYQLARQQKKRSTKLRQRVRHPRKPRQNKEPSWTWPEDKA